MGWLEGMVTGYQSRSHELEKQKMEEAVAANEREARVYQALLASNDPYARQLAAAGMLQSTAPRRRSGGLRGWLGEVEGNPIFPTLQKYMTTPRETVTEQVTPGLPARQTTGYLPGAPTGSDLPMGMSSIQTTMPGAPGPQPASPLPAGSVSTHEEPELEGLAPNYTAKSAPPQLTIAPTAPDVTYTPGPKVGRVDRTTSTSYPDIFPTPEDIATRQARGKAIGDIQGDLAGYQEVARQMGYPDWQEQGARLWVQQNQKAQQAAYGTAPTELEWTDPATGQLRRGFANQNRFTGQMTMIDGSPLPAGAHKAPTQMSREEFAARQAIAWKYRDQPTFFRAWDSASKALGTGAPLDQVAALADSLYGNAPRVQPGEALPGGINAPAPATPPAPGAAQPQPGIATQPGVLGPPQPGLAPQPQPGVVAPAPGAAAPAVTAPSVAAPPPTGPGARILQDIESQGAGNLTQRTRQAPTDTQRKDVAYLEQLQMADGLATTKGPDGWSIEERIANQSLWGQIRGTAYPNNAYYGATLDADQRQYRAAQKAFTEARLRAVSGAQVRPDEYAMDAQIYFVQPGDDPKTITFKRELRQKVIDSFGLMTGPAYFEKYSRPYTPQYMRPRSGPPSAPGTGAGGAVPIPNVPVVPPNNMMRPTQPPGAVGTAGPGTPVSIFDPKTNKYIIVYQ